MIFAHDTEVALASAAALVNTGRGGKELLPDLAALDRFVADWGWTGGRAHDQAELDAVQRLRPRLERLWSMDADAAAGLVNTLLRESSALPQLVKHDQWDYHLHATPPDAPLADRARGPVQEPVAPVLQRRLRQPHQRRRLPPAGAGWPVRHVAPASSALARSVMMLSTRPAVARSSAGRSPHSRRVACVTAARIRS